MLNFKNKQFSIVEKFKYFIAVSLIIVLVGAGFLLFKGMNVGIDFSGGATISIKLGSFAGDSSAKQIINDKVTDILQDNGLKQVGALQVSNEKDGGYTYEFRLSYYHNGELKTKAEEQEFMSFIQGDLYDNTVNGLCGDIQTELETLFSTNDTFTALGATIESDSVGAHTVGATASGVLLQTALIALLIAIVVMLIYIVIRFTVASALAAICALLHDVLIMIALTTIFQIPVNSTFVAAIITIVGYSINATIVIFDRIREESKNITNKGKTDEEIANFSIARTLNRSILTTITTFLMVLFLAFLSVATIQEFIIPIIFGLIAGVYSSVFLASSFWVMFRKLGAKIKAKKNKKSA